MQYRAEIDGLRAVAVIAVILFHAGAIPFSGGFVGVDIFFVISGYLITSIVIEETQRETFSLIRFYERRVRRIIPALLLVMAVSIPLSFIFLLPSYLVDFGKSLIAVPAFLSNLLFWSERGYFGAPTEMKPLIHTWSLAVEEQFYLVYPLLIMVLTTVLALKRKKIISILSVCFIISLAASWYLTKLHFSTAFYLPVARAWELLAGAICAILAFDGIHFHRRGSFWSILGVLLIVFSIVAFDKETLFPGLAALLPVTGTILIIASPAGNIVHAWLSHRRVVYVGLISYSLYLWHQPIFSFVHHADLPDYCVYFTFPLIAGLAVFSYHYVETPIRRGALTSRATLFGWAAAGNLAVAAIGVVIVTNDGFLHRFSDADVEIMEQYASESFGNYNLKRAREFSMRNFDDSGKTKIFIVGDSYANDLVNVLYEGGLDLQYEISTKQINSECGNLYVDEDLTKFIPKPRRERCRWIGRFDTESVQRIARDADEIWLVSYWLEWTPQFLPATIANLEKDFGTKVRVFGVKNFGRITQKIALSIDEDDRSNYRQAAETESIRINSEMKKIVPRGKFVELLNGFCSGTAEACRPFTDKAKLISPDGGHLTPAGAQYLAPKLRAMLKERGQDFKELVDRDHET